MLMRMVTMSRVRLLLCRLRYVRVQRMLAERHGERGQPLEGEPEQQHGDDQPAQHFYSIELDEVRRQGRAEHHLLVLAAYSVSEPHNRALLDYPFRRMTRDQHGSDLPQGGLMTDHEHGPAILRPTDLGEHGRKGCAGRNRRLGLEVARQGFRGLLRAGGRARSQTAAPSTTGASTTIDR